MKTQINTNNMKKMAVTAFIALVFATGSFTQPNFGNNKKTASLVRLESLINDAENAIRYVAPEAVDLTEELGRLEDLAAVTEASVKYEVPEEITAEMDRLNVLADATEASVKYEAPGIAEVTSELERLDLLAAANEVAAMYRAPDTHVMNNAENQNTDAQEIMLAVNNR